MSGTGTSSKTSGFWYSSMRAAFMCFSFLWSSAADRGRGCFCHGDILLDRSRARSDRAHDVAADPDRQAATEDHDLAVIALLDPEERRAGLRQRRQIGGRLVEYSRRHRLANGEIDASDQGAVLTCESNERSSGIDDGDVV